MQNPRVRLALMAVSTLALLAIAGFVIFADPRLGRREAGRHGRLRRLDPAAGAGGRLHAAPTRTAAASASPTCAGAPWS